jgi:hypothetical protein
VIGFVISTIPKMQIQIHIALRPEGRKIVKAGFRVELACYANCSTKKQQQKTQDVTHHFRRPYQYSTVCKFLITFFNQEAVYRNCRK